MTGKLEGRRMRERNPGENKSDGFVKEVDSCEKGTTEKARRQKERFKFQRARGAGERSELRKDKEGS